VDPAADHDVFQLPCLNKMPDLALGDTDPRRKLLGGFEALGHVRFHPEDSRLWAVCCAARWAAGESVAGMQPALALRQYAGAASVLAGAAAVLRQFCGRLKSRNPLRQSVSAKRPFAAAVVRRTLKGTDATAALPQAAQMASGFCVGALVLLQVGF
jgi:hypothetical protein